MFQEEDYINSEEPYTCFEAPKNGCRWAGCLYQRKNGGFDLFYDHANSEVKPLDLAKITLLRHMSEAQSGVVFIARVDEEASEKKLIEHARQRLLEWIASTIGTEFPGAKII